MKLISHQNFGNLRLKQFLEENLITKLWNWEFMEDLWVGDSYLFTEFLRPYKNPFTTKSVSLSLEDLPLKTVHEILTHLGLPLKKKSTTEEIIGTFGKPKQIYDRVKDRMTYEFVIGQKEKYYISCTLLKNDGGLVYISMMNHEKTINNLLNGTLYD